MRSCDECGKGPGEDGRQPEPTYKVTSTHGPVDAEVTISVKIHFPGRELCKECAQKAVKPLKLRDLLEGDACNRSPGQLKAQLDAVEVAEAAVNGDAK